MTSPPNEKRRPGKAANPKSLAGDSSRIQPIGNSSVATGRRYWARQLIERQTPERPMYGSTQWLMLPNDHPDKIASCVIAAECWATRADNLESELRQEIELAQHYFKRAEDEAYKASYEAHRKRFESLGRRRGLSFQERRAAQLATTQARPDDFPGLNDGGRIG